LGCFRGDIISQNNTSITIRWKNNIGYVGSVSNQEVCETVYPDPVWYCNNYTQWVCDWEWELQDWVNCRWESWQECDWGYGPPYTQCYTQEVTASLSPVNVLPIPSSSFTINYNCGVNYQITRNGTPTGGHIWYWQDTNNGFSTANSGSTYLVTTPEFDTCALKMEIAGAMPLPLPFWQMPQLLAERLQAMWKLSYRQAARLAFPVTMAM
jgi:hypothetical protein